ncbi:MAG: hypothetical protein WC878_06860 [Candidatus Paceibacterota bacterium]|jgi:hypothetical protein
MPQELNKIWNAGKLFEPKPEPEQPAKQPESEPKPSTVKRKKSVIGAFMDKQEDPFKEKVEAVLKGIEEVKPEPAEKAPDTENLESNGIVIVGPLEEEFDPKEFFSDDNKSAKLSVWDSFANITASARSAREQPSTALSSYTLTKAMNDSEIRAELPKNHVFSQDDLWMIADLIKSDKLLNNGYANLFYVEAGASVLVVSVHRDGSDWHVHGWELDENGQWNDGCRVFSRNS